MNFSKTVNKRAKIEGESFWETLNASMQNSPASTQLLCSINENHINKDVLQLYQPSSRQLSMVKHQKSFSKHKS
jgi:hypothetical protein